MPNASLEIVLAPLVFETHVSIIALGTCPDILHTLASKLGVTLWCQENGHSKIVGYMLQHSLLIKEVLAHAHDVSQTCAGVDCPKVILLTVPVPIRIDFDPANSKLF